MNTSTYCCSAGQLLVSIFVILSATGICAEIDSTPLGQKEFQEIETAWRVRTSQIHSLTMRIDMEEFIKGRGDKPLDIKKNSPFSDSRPSIDRVLKIAIDYAFKQGKAVLTRTGPILDPNDPEKTSQQTMRFSFDGRECRSLGEQTGFPAMGSFEKRNSPDGPIIQNADLFAIHLWMQPTAL